jgi:LysM repeat protein
VQQLSAQPRVTDLPMRLATNDVPAQAPPAQVNNEPPATTIAQSSFFSSPDQTATNIASALSNEQPLTTLAETKLSSLPNLVKPQAAQADSPVLEAKLPAQSTFNTNTAVENSMRQSQPLSTLVNTQSPNAVLTQSTSAPAAPQRYFQVNDAMSMPTREVFVAPAKVKKVDVPVFPQASLNGRSAKVNSVPAKSTFTAPSAGIVETNVSSRMAQATPGNHSSALFIANAQIGEMPGDLASTPSPAVSAATSSKPLFTAPSVSLANARMAQATAGSHTESRLMADAQIGELPGYIAPKPVSTPRHMVSQRPLFTAPDAPTMASSRIASANISGTWGYQHNTRETVKTTKPQIAFLPKFNSTPKNDSFASITVSPVSTKVQVSEMSQSWPAVYYAKQNERLSAIAERYGMPIEVLAKNNNLQKNAILTAGEKIKMPRNLQITYNGKALHSDVSSMLVGTTSVAAFRFLFEQQGGKVTWDSASQTVHARNGDTEVSLTIGSDQAMINQKTTMMDMAAFLLSGRTMVPVRLFEKSLNAHVTWDPSTGRMFMAMAG